MVGGYRRRGLTPIRFAENKKRYGVFFPVNMFVRFLMEERGARAPCAQKRTLGAALSQKRQCTLGCDSTNMTALLVVEGPAYPPRTINTLLVYETITKKSSVSC